MSSFPIYILSIKRAKHRLDAIVEATKGLDLDLRPIEGVDGSLIDRKDWTAIKPIQFAINTGRIPMPGEYGCYASHIRAMETFLQTDEPVALICEDDIVLDADTKRKIENIISAMPRHSVVKLTCHRRRGFVKREENDNGVTFGRYLCGPQASSAAYLVSRSAALRFVKKHSKMCMPFDRTLEEGWRTGINILNVEADVFEFGKVGSIVNMPGGYRKSKFFPLFRIPSYLRSAYDNVARIIYAYI